MQPTATDGVAWSICNYHEPCKKAELIEMLFGMWNRVRGLDPHGEGHFWGKWRRDFPTRCPAPFIDAMTLGFPHMLSTSVPTGWPKKQLSATLHFPNEKSPLWCGLSSKFFHHFSMYVSPDYITTHPFNGLFSRKTWVSWRQKGNHSGFYWSNRWWGGSGISWTICKSFVPRSRQITMPVPHH